MIAVPPLRAYPAPTVHVASTQALLGLCADRGVALSRQITISRIPMAARLEYDQMVAMWDEAEALLADDILGLHVAGHAPLGAYAAMDYLFQSCRDVRAALAVTARYFPLANGGARLELVPCRGGLALELHSLVVPPRHLHRSVQYTFAVLLDRIGVATGVRCRPRAATMPGPPPRHRAELASAFGAQIEFAADTARLILDAATVQRGHRFPDPELAALLEGQLRERANGREADAYLVRECRRLLVGQPTGDSISMVALAGKLSMSPRSLQRRLLAAGTSYRELADDARRDTVLTLLQDGMRPTEVGRLSRFASYRAFARAMRRWTGMTPAGYIMRDDCGPEEVRTRQTNGGSGAYAPAR